MLGITSGHVDMGPQMSKEDYNARDHLSMLCDGPDECVRAVREQFRMGAKFIKICATGGVSSPTDRRPGGTTAMLPPTAPGTRGPTRLCWPGWRALSTASCSPSGRLS